MRHTNSVVLVLILTAVLAACGGGNPNGPGPEPSSEPIVNFQIVSGLNGQPVTPSLLAVTGATQTGATTFTNVVEGADVTVLASDFLDRETKVRTFGSHAEVLWPLAYNTTPEYIQQLLYRDFFPGGRLSRIEAPVAYLVPGAGFEDRHHQIQEAADKINAILAGRLSLRVMTNPPPDAVIFHVRVDPGDPFFVENPNAPAGAPRGFRGNAIVSGRALFRAADLINPRRLLHEIGHLVGLGHSSELHDVMSNVGGAADFSDKEKLALSMLYHRRPGNVFPDNDRSVSGAWFFAPPDPSCQ